MDPPFPDGGQSSSYTNSLLAGHGQQSPCVSELTGMGSYFLHSSGPQDQSPHLSESRSLSAGPTLSQQQQEQQQHSHPTQNATPYSSMTSNPHCPSRSHQIWPSPPPGPDDFDNYSYQSSPTCGSAPTYYNPSPVSPRTWSSPDYAFPVSSESLHTQKQQDSFKNLRACTPTSTESFPVRGPQVLTPFTGGMNPGPEADIDGLPHSESPATIPDMSAGALSGTNSPKEPFLDAPAHNATKEEAPAGEPEKPGSPGRQLETRELQDSAVGAKADEPYAQLIYRALMAAPNHELTLQEIYQWFRVNTDKAKDEKPGEKQGWQNSIRHNLSMNKAFVKKSERKQAPSSASSATDQSTTGDPKRSTEWMLEDWAIRDGVQSTTRYRANLTRRGMGPKALHHPYNHGFQQHGNPISTKAISGRKGGCATSKSKLRGHRYGHGTGMPPTSHRIMPHGPHAIRSSTMPSMYQPPYGYNEMMIPRLETQPQMAFKQEQNYSSMTPDPTAPNNSFGLMIPEPSLAHAQAQAQAHAHAQAQVVTSSASNNHGMANYALAGASQGHMYAGAPPCEFPFGLGDVTDAFHGSAAHHCAGGAASQRLMGMGHNPVYGWSNNGP